MNTLVRFVESFFEETEDGLAAFPDHESFELQRVHQLRLDMSHYVTCPYYALLPRESKDKVQALIHRLKQSPIDKLEGIVRHWEYMLLMRQFQALV